jgi:spoIIIJ-associated protein
VEWVETTARSIDEAKDFLLDQLGVDSDDAEFEILEEPKAGLFGRQRGEARVRARIAPKSPRGKESTRRRAPKTKGPAATPKASAPPAATDKGAADTRSADRGRGDQSESGRDRQTRERESVAPEPFIAPLIAFLEGVVAAAGLSGEVVVSVTDDGDLAAAILGDQLGALIGPAGGVVEALQELSRTFLQKEAKGGSAPRLKVDVGGYRADRKIALEAFVVGVAEKVRSTGSAHAFEYMGSVDRKTIHDAVTDLEDIESSSEGEDPDRYVVLSPA